MRNWASGVSFLNPLNLEAQSSTLSHLRIRKCDRGISQRSPSCPSIITLTGFNLNNAAYGFHWHVWCSSTPYVHANLFDIHRCNTNPYYISTPLVLCFILYPSIEPCSVYLLFSFQLRYRENGKLTRLSEDWIMELDY